MQDRIIVKEGKKTDTIKYDIFEFNSDDDFQPPTPMRMVTKSGHKTSKKASYICENDDEPDDDSAEVKSEESSSASEELSDDQNNNKSLQSTRRRRKKICMPNIISTGKKANWKTPQQTSRSTKRVMTPGIRKRTEPRLKPSNSLELARQR